MILLFFFFSSSLVLLCYARLFRHKLEVVKFQHRNLVLRSFASVCFLFSCFLVVILWAFYNLMMSCFPLVTHSCFASLYIYIAIYLYLYIYAHTGMNAICAC
ncbi:uncharacterized protein VTP21DRAFT_5517 [Calcarisporiella thermophila]|uniref:uncharacterized protein n=1 Tax=Calcarisporiella thermophila TaxID=911321 RepID=UPI0037438705